MIVGDNIEKFQSSFELTGYITVIHHRSYHS